MCTLARLPWWALLLGLAAAAATTTAFLPLLSPTAFLVHAADVTEQEEAASTETPGLEEEVQKEEDVKGGGSDDLVTVWAFQADGEMTTDTWALLEEPLQPLQELSVCFWYKVFYWRMISPVVSLSLDAFNDDVLLIGMTLEYLDIVIISSDTRYVGRFPLMKYIHMCVMVAETAMLYVDGQLIAGSDWIERVVNRTMEGVLVLGQDQDKPKGGYNKEHSFSGEVIDFHTFARIVNREEVLAMAQCAAPPSDAFVTQASGWLLSNVSASTITRQELCRQDTLFFLFKRSVQPKYVDKLCGSLHGYMPTTDDADAIAKRLHKYFGIQDDFFKLYIPVKLAQVNDSGYSFMSLKLIWDNGDFLPASLSPTGRDILHFSLVCSMKEGTTLKLMGLPEKVQSIVDSQYQLYIDEGEHFLRGVQNSVIRQHTNVWCLYPKHNQNTPVWCTDTSSNFPPVGRKYWALPDNRTLRLTLSGCGKDEFTCDSGHCVDLRRRCDSRKNCQDRSDEDNCDMIRVDTKQRTSVARVPFEAKEVEGSIELSYLSEINLPDNNFVASIHMSLSWTDRRLAFFNLPSNTTKAGKLPAKNMWLPMVVPYPVKTDGKPRTKSVEVWQICEGTASVYGVWEEKKFSSRCVELWLEMFYQERWQCDFLLDKYPFEKVQCYILLELQDYQRWHPQRVNVTIPVFKHLPYMVSYNGHRVNGSELIIRLKFQRQFSGFVVTTFIPLSLLIIIAFLTFFFERDDFTNRVMVTLSVFIVLASLFSQTSADLPDTSYIKCIDYFFLCSMSLITLVFACHVILSLLQRHAAHNVIKMRPRPSPSSVFFSSLHANQKRKYNHQEKKRRFRCSALASSNQMALAVCCCALIACLPLLATNCF